MDEEMEKNCLGGSGRLTATYHMQRMASFDDSQRIFNRLKPNLRNHRLAMFKRCEIVASIDENYTYSGHSQREDANRSR